MASDWLSLTQQAIGVVQLAQQYVQTRANMAVNPDQVSAINAWAGRLNVYHDELQVKQQEYSSLQETLQHAARGGAAFALEREEEREPSYELLSEQLQLTAKQIQSLHEYYKLADVGLV